MPTTASCGRQVRFSTSSAQSSAIGSRGAGEGELAVDLVAQHARRLLGLLDALRRDLDVEVGQLISPVASSSSRDSSPRSRRKLEGTMPEASPEWTPSVSTRTVSMPAAMPRSEVVSHSWS